MSSAYEDAKLTSIVVAISMATVILLVYAVQRGSVYSGGISAVAYSAIICFGIQWVAWVPASYLQTERFYDLTGGFTFISLGVFTLWAGALHGSAGPRELLVTGLVIVWSLRLSIFLFLRIHHAGKDGRFDDLKTSPVRFLVPWTLQGLWVFITMNVVIVINCQSVESPPLGIWDAIGGALWLAGFAIEVIADNQKSAFNKKPENDGRWIQDGLWSYSRHPNYLGEIMLWTGVGFFGIACFTGFEGASWVSPIFVYLLLTKISGIPLLDKRGVEKWGADPNYLEYRKRTPAIFPSIIGKTQK